MYLPWSYSRGVYFLVCLSSLTIAWYRTGVASYFQLRKIQTLFSSTLEIRGSRVNRKSIKQPLDIPPPLQPNQNKATNKTVPYRHSEEIKRIISAANMGRVPWNAGSRHSEETKAKIRSSVLAKVHAEKLAKAALLGISLEEYDSMKKNARNERNRLAHKEKRKARLDALNATGILPQKRVSRHPSSKVGRVVSNETRMKIAKKVKAHWENGVYNSSKTNETRNETLRTKIGQKLKELWQDPEFRATQLSKRRVITNETKARISMKIKEKWQDTSYREMVMKSIHARHDSSNKNFTSRRSNSTRSSKPNPDATESRTKSKSRTKSNSRKSHSPSSSSSRKRSTRPKARATIETDSYPLQMTTISKAKIGEKRSIKSEINHLKAYSYLIGEAENDYDLDFTQNQLHVHVDDAFDDSRNDEDAYDRDNIDDLDGSRDDDIIVMDMEFLSES